MAAALVVFALSTSLRYGRDAPPLHFWLSRSAGIPQAPRDAAGLSLGCRWSVFGGEIPRREGAVTTLWMVPAQTFFQRQLIALGLRRNSVYPVEMRSPADGAEHVECVVNGCPWPSDTVCDERLTGTWAEWRGGVAVQRLYLWPDGHGEAEDVTYGAPRDARKGIRWGTRESLLLVGRPAAVLEDSIVSAVAVMENGRTTYRRIDGSVGRREAHAHGDARK